MAWGGINVFKSGEQVAIVAQLYDDVGGVLTAGTTTAQLFEVQADVTLKSYDFNDNTFKTTALTTATLALTARTGNNSTQSTGLWTNRITTVNGFTIGGRYIAMIENALASPTVQFFEFQYGGSEGDLFIHSGTATAGAATTITLDSGASAVDNFYNNQQLTIVSGTGARQSRVITDYVGATKVATVDTWGTNPASGSMFVITPFGVAASGGGGGLDAAGVRAAVGLASANLDTQLGDLPTNAELATALAAADDAILAVVAALNNLSSAQVLTQVESALVATLADSLPADGTRPSLAQAIYAQYLFLTERSVASTTLTVKKVDGTTTAMTFTLNDAASPTSITRAT